MAAATLSVFIPFTILVLIATFGLTTVSAAAASGEAKFYELKKGNFSVKFTNWGASVVSVVLPDKNGEFADVVLGYDSANDYKNNTPNFGVTAGRVANRIKGANFSLNGHVYQLIANDGKNTLHGGPNGFGKVSWKMEKLTNYGQKPYIIFSYNSLDGDQGFPGKLAATVKYMLMEDYSLSITMTAQALDKPTPVNLAHHTYWNLRGHDSGDILDNIVQINASRITILDKELIPTGQIKPVTGTPYDFRKPTVIRRSMARLPKGFDINYALDNDNAGRHDDEMRRVAVVRETVSGRTMEVLANQPGVQFYTSNTLRNVVGKGRHVYQNYAGLCLESQGFPDAVHHPNFPSTIVQPGDVYKHSMLFRFSIEDE